ncbi:MAG: hypothetical protein QXM27_03320 [Candidatus Pacearchaeota archaeon]
MIFSKFYYQLYKPSRYKIFKEKLFFQYKSVEGTVDVQIKKLRKIILTANSTLYYSQTFKKYNIDIENFSYDELKKTSYSYKRYN